MIRAVIDTNVLVSVLLSKSEESSVIKLIDAVLDGKIIPLYNNEIVTGNLKHFPKTPIVVTPAQMLDILNL